MAAQGYNRDPARIGELEFTYADPAVNVTTEQRTVEQETIDDQIVVQTLGRKPDSLSIEGVVVDYELEIIDNLTQQGVLSLRTERWSGDILVQSTSTSFKRAKTKDGDWLYDATIEALEVEEGSTVPGESSTIGSLDTEELGGFEIEFGEDALFDE